MELEVRHLRILVAIAEHGSISKAASASGVAQPSLSAQLVRIEHLLGVRVFERSRAGISTTEHGRQVLATARTVLAEMARLPVTGTALDDSVLQPAVRLAGPPGPLLGATALQLGRAGHAVYCTADPSTANLVQEVQAGRLDAALLALPVEADVSPSAKVRRATFVPREPVFVAVAHHGPLARKSAVDLTDLAGSRWVVDPHDDTGDLAEVRKLCAGAGLDPDVGCETADAGTAREFVSSGQYISLAQAISRESPGIAIRPITGDPLCYRWDLVWSSHCRLDPQVLLDAGAEAYLTLVDRNPAFYRWWAEFGSTAPARPPISS
ncbi:LysR family transcriptional regulator [Kribbella sp. NPDC051587]|uniref:LysR family transcriptional regulator n=1 Tax=Kribbella sp. NPDC051587 TaxID=3364119 RepID=UPI00378ED3B2